MCVQAGAPGPPGASGQQGDAGHVTAMEMVMDKDVRMCSLSVLMEMDKDVRRHQVRMRQAVGS